MAANILKKLKFTLDQCISNLDANRDRFCSRPGIDFSRSRKIDIPTLCNSVIQLQSKSLPCEMLDFWKHSPDTPTPSALIQQREKLSTDAFGFLFRSFRDKTSKYQSRKYRGYRLIAADGSDVNIFRNPSDEETYIREGEKGYNAVHINAMYDLLNHTYTDVLFQGKRKLHERAAFNDMIDRSEIKKAIFIADRGYESFNTFAHVMEAGRKFVIRMKDISSNGILSAYDLPDSGFDTWIDTTLTKRHTKETLGNPDTYTILPHYTDFDFLDSSHTTYHIRFRVVRFLTDSGKYVCVATNLPPSQFPPEDIRNLYKLRWGEETSFRELKYTIGLVNFHSRKKELIYQEIYARMLLYNFCEIVTCRAVAHTSGDTKHSYRINFTTAVNTCRAYLRDGGPENELMQLIQRHLTPIRDDRNYTLNLRTKRNRDFVYRAA